MIFAAYRRHTFERLTEREEIELGLAGVHANSAFWDRLHRDDIRLDVIQRWPTTLARLITDGAHP